MHWNIYKKIDLLDEIWISDLILLSNSRKVVKYIGIDIQTQFFFDMCLDMVHLKGREDELLLDIIRYCPQNSSNKL